MSAAEVKAQFEIAKQGLKAIRDKNSTARQAAEQGNQSIIGEINDINDKIAKIKELVARSNNLDSALKAKEDELEKLNKERGDLNTEFDNVKQERDKLQQQLKESEDNLGNVNAIVVTRDEEAREKNNALEELQREMNEERTRLEGINQDLQDLLADITQVNREINETDGEVQTLNQYNQETVENIKTLLQKVNIDLNDILNMPQPPASRMQQIHQDRVTSRAANENTDALGEEGLGGLFDEPATPPPSIQEESAMISPQDKAVEEASKEPWWATLNPSEQANYRRVPEQRSVLRQEGKKRLQEQADKAGIESTWNDSDDDGFYDNFSEGESVSGKWDPPAPAAPAAAPAPSSKPIYLTEWKNMMTPDEMNLFNRDPSTREELEAEGKRRIAEKKKSVGGRRTRRSKAGLRRHSKTHKKGGYVAVYKKSSRRSSSKSKKTRSKRSSNSSKGHKSRKH